MAVKLQATSTTTTHGLLIQANGSAIGAITDWAPKQNMTATPVFEFGQVTVGGGDDIMADRGEPFEIVPANIGGTTVSISRYDIYTNRFENAFKTNNLQMLTRQDKAIKLIEFWATPDDVANFSNIYYGAWFTSIGRQHKAEGNRIVMVSAELMYTRKREA